MKKILILLFITGMVGCDVNDAHIEQYLIVKRVELNTISEKHKGKFEITFISKHHEVCLYTDSIVKVGDTIKIKH